MPSRGDEVVYRSVSGVAYAAVVAAVRDDGRVDVEVAVPGADSVQLTRVRFFDAPTGECGAWPR